MPAQHANLDAEINPGRPGEHVSTGRIRCIKWPKPLEFGEYWDVIPEDAISAIGDSLHCALVLLQEALDDGSDEGSRLHADHYTIIYDVMQRLDELRHHCRHATGATKLRSKLAAESGE